MSSNSFATEKQFAVAAVRRACSLTASVFSRLVTAETVTKNDKSPVTVADYAAQALIAHMLANAFPDDKIVGEEDASDLRLESSVPLLDRIVQLTNDAVTADLIEGDLASWGIGSGKQQTAHQLLDAIDRGNFEGGPTGRMWTIDPIDGTKGFLRGGQYAVCLALIVDGEAQVGVLGCPNLPQKVSDPDGPKGCIFAAVRGHGAEQLSMHGMDPTRLAMPHLAKDQLNLLESVEAAHADHSFNDQVSSILGITRPSTRMDSQAKYACLARGDGGIYLRIPSQKGYKEKIWDHASGSLLVQEAGGAISNCRGEALSFGLGRTLGENYGVMASGRAVHPSVLAAIQTVRPEFSKL
ncbi:hypothetical protein DL96DRAFT_1703143 [Flagelloscypha sp. PMI_526]|nr:hypothetical protein DL96DRAFT_1703143 [Flagelloscypha sp. PMI_526]